MNSNYAKFKQIQNWKNGGILEFHSIIPISKVSLIQGLLKDDYKLHTYFDSEQNALFILESNPGIASKFMQSIKSKFKIDNISYTDFKK